MTGAASEVMTLQRNTNPNIIIIIIIIIKSRLLGPSDPWMESIYLLPSLVQVGSEMAQINLLCVCVCLSTIVTVMFVRASSNLEL